MKTIQNKFEITIIFAIPFLLLSCSNYKNYDEITAKEQIQVSFENTKQQTEKIVSNIESVTLIPLDIESVILPNLPQVRVTENHIYLFSGKQQELYIFLKKDGKYINKISRFGNGPEEYINIENFSISASSDIIMFDAGKTNCLRFDKNGNFIEEHILDKPATNYAYINDSSFVSFVLSRYLMRQNPNVLRVVDKYGKEKKSFLPLPMWLDDSFSPATGSYFSYNGLEVLFTVPFGNNIYEVLEDTVVCRYNIDFGNRSVPVNFYELHQKEIASDLMYVLNLIFDKEWAFDIEFYQESSNFVFFQFMINQQIYYVFYNKTLKNTLMTEFRLLPVEWALVLKSFLASDANGFYSMVMVNQLDHLIKLGEQLTDKRLIELRQQFIDYKKEVKIDEDDYVLLYYKMKN